MPSWNYPQAFRDESAIDTYQSETRGEVKVADPYRWLEEPYSEKTKEWVSQQVDLFSKYMMEEGIEEKVGATREELVDQLTKMVNFEKVGCPFKRGKGDLTGYYYFKNDGLQNQDVMWVRRSLESDEAEVFVDPNTFSADGTSSIRSSAFTKNGDYYAYGLSEKGSDWQTIKVMDVKTKEHLPDSIKFCKFTSISWTHDSKGFFYTRYPEPKSSVESLGSEVDPNENSKLYYHKLGTSQLEDILIYGDRSQPKWMFGGFVSDDGLYLIITVSESTAPVNRLFFTKVYKNDEIGGELAFEKVDPNDSESPIKVVKYIDNFDAEYDYITNEGTMFYFKTNLNAPNSKVIYVDVNKPYTEMKELIPETEDPMSIASIGNNDCIIANYVHNVQDVLKFYNLSTGEYINDIQLPAVGSVASISAKKEDSILFYKFVSFNHPGTVYKYDFNTKETSVFYQTKTSDLVPSPDSIEVKQEWYTSKDGTQVPMFIVHQKEGFEKNGNNPTWLYGYGGFSISLQPSFSVMRLFWIKYFGGIVAIPNLRGGNEIGGEKWHEQGILDRKQNVFDDMIAAAEYLIKEGYTSPARIALNGGSNGGLLVSAVVNQRPDLIRVGVPMVGVLDMLKFHTWTIGHAWCSDYGCSSDPKGFDYLSAYSPLHNIKPQKYPAVLVTTANHDDRVVPHHSFKYTAQLQHVAGPVNESPLLCRIEVNAGHGAGKSLAMSIREMVDVYMFAAANMGVKYTKK
ncbi:prolyl oligopeptidase family protein [Naegleria gruberi]|uniref:Prolyl endopeptidase n=1 Tax=Naegleria gruberi TaxID=5762 RepID=D2V264_NAEGR|nr:prolyl oligopeptidase family protein [Naegleria gruberi]EFC48850.1 prolyl oligopeptidase family protein [Naegleria gruberi]|eukprot:XP_002681594.1 prolyl oligopeptidase family protein [Naegleria gruberi strain NEG-M]